MGIKLNSCAQTVCAKRYDSLLKPVSIILKTFIPGTLFKLFIYKKKKVLQTESVNMLQ